ncbi:MAG TPA: isoprenylcysteine carboxylmethyltransferase family protein [Candidatus Eisenbacteria bacterium]|nr:isoprenylcysteine carboxylmethyltransferase family protein [Candidatus Eisenbacteria bacterium]
MSGSKGHGAKVIFIPPPFLFAGGFLAGVWLRRFVPGDALPARFAVAARAAGLPLVAAGVAFALWGILTFFRAKTTIVPHRAVSSLVDHGPYRLTRNPMYVGLTAAYTGLALVQNRLWPFAFLPFVLAILVAAVILPEERYLEERFGDDYRAYKRRVRRLI